MNRIATILLLFLLSVGSTFAQKDGQINIKSVSIKKIYDTVHISFEATIPRIASGYQLTFTPEIYNATQRESLTPIVVMGKRKMISNKRSNAPSDAEHEGIISKGTVVVSYKFSLPYEPWMSELSLQINRTIEGCCNEKQLSAYSVVKNRVVQYDIKPQYDLSVLEPKPSSLEVFDKEAPFLYPATDYEHRYEIFEQQREKGALIVHFKQGLSTIDPNYKKNREALTKVNRAVELIDADPKATLKKIVVVGLASPEGSLARNDLLAEKRATALKYFVGEHVKYDPNLFEIINGSEDWAGLKKLVEASRMPGRWQVLETIENYPIYEGREKRLMDLNGGKSYRYMKEYFFPQLRNAGYIQIYYETTPNPEEELLKNAVEQIANKRYDKALALLLSKKSDTPLENLIGVCYMMMGHYKEAEAYFERAIDNGDSDAVANLQQLKIAQTIQ